MVVSKKATDQRDIEMINEFVSGVDRIKVEFGLEARDMALQEIGLEVDLSVHSIKTNYLPKRAYNTWKLPAAIRKTNEIYERLKNEKELDGMGGEDKAQHRALLPTGNDMEGTGQIGTIKNGNQ